MFYKSALKVSVFRLPSFTAIKALALLITGSGHTVLLTTVYRPGSATVSDTFFDKFDKLISIVTVTNYSCVMLRDFNIHVDDTTDAHAERLSQSLGAYGLISRHRNVDIHSTSKDYAIQRLSVSDPALSDHCCIDFQLPFRTPKPILQEAVQTTRWSEFDVDAFEAELMECELVLPDSNDTEYLFSLYRQTLTDLLDQHSMPGILVKLVNSSIDMNIFFRLKSTRLLRQLSSKHVS